MSLIKKLGIAVAAPVAAYGAFVGTMKTIDECYSRKVWATPEEEAMTLPGDDLSVDPNGIPGQRVTQSMDLDAPVEEVWKHIYQMGVEKAGYYSWANFERLFTMNVNNCYNLQEMWQGEDQKKPGDFWSWGMAGFGAEVADCVPNKYIVWADDSRNPSKAPGATSILVPTMEYLRWNWTIALTPLDGGKRCHIISRYTLSYGPHNAFNNNLLGLVISKGGAMMTRRMFENLEKAANYNRPKSLGLKVVEKVAGAAHGAPDDLHNITSFPEVRFGRDCPRVESYRAPITDDPNWPPAPGEDYVPPFEENNAKCGWTPAKHAENDAIAEAKWAAIREKYNL